MADGELHPAVLSTLRNGSVSFQLRKHRDLGSAQNPDEVAQYLGYDRSRITKTLLLKGAPGGNFYLAVLPVAARADFRNIAAHLCVSRCSIAGIEELEAKLNQPPGGVSPLGAREIPVLLDPDLRRHETVLIGGGARGVEVELAPSDLASLTRGQWLAISRAV